MEISAQLASQRIQMNVAFKDAYIHTYMHACMHYRLPIQRQYTVLDRLAGCVDGRIRDGPRYIDTTELPGQLASIKGGDVVCQYEGITYRRDKGQ
jgi:hypothetical protein